MAVAVSQRGVGAGDRLEGGVGRADRVGGKSAAEGGEGPVRVAEAYQTDFAQVREQAALLLGRGEVDVALEHLGELLPVLGVLEPLEEPCAVAALCVEAPQPRQRLCGARRASAHERAVRHREPGILLRRRPVQ